MNSVTLNITTIRNGPRLNFSQDDKYLNERDIKKGMHDIRWITGLSFTQSTTEDVAESVWAPLDIEFGLFNVNASIFKQVRHSFSTWPRCLIALSHAQ